MILGYFSNLFYTLDDLQYISAVYFEIYFVIFSNTNRVILKYPYTEDAFQFFFEVDRDSKICSRDAKLIQKKLHQI